MSAVYQMRVVNGQLTEDTQGTIRLELEKLHSIKHSLTLFKIIVDLEDGNSTTVELKASDEDSLELVSTASADNVMDAVHQSVQNIEHQIRQQRSENKLAERHDKLVSKAKHNLTILLSVVGVLAALIILVAVIRNLPSRPPTVTFDKKPTFPVAGELFLNGKPLKDATVVLRPAEDSEANERWPFGYPRGTVMEDGTFDIGTYEDHDGAPAGDYVILAVGKDGKTAPRSKNRRDKSGRPEMADGQEAAPPPVDAPPEPAPTSNPTGVPYNDPQSPLGRFTVEEKENIIPRLDPGKQT